MTGNFGLETENRWWVARQELGDEYHRSLEAFLAELRNLRFPVYTVTTGIHDSVCVTLVDPDLYLDEGI